ncbi:MULTISPECIES: radical SAM protein [unclassified Butyrivibrio]|jgi:nitrogen fixation protein NifB|uniref:radical SAM protein n=1 Tax=unclassified Butyrivibrio TaxID=2639466 RepID=UPI0003F6F636|nr:MULTISPECIES: radical SAM protein [unclassified Butyrivibrio]MCR5343684.1 radical SAM protein [Butyrivibrio sp.]
MARSIEELEKNHPCFGGCKFNAGRIHLPVSPGCNIACRFCDRSINDVEQRPGVTSKVISPDEANDFIGKAIELVPSIKVAGIAGPGDTLATDYALQTFEKIGEAHPELLKCMSTNGLLLNERAQEVIDAGVDTLTVTVNAVDPEIEAKLNDYIIYHGEKIEGVEAAKILIENQLKGIKKVADAGVTIKINTVLVPGINDHHISEIAKTVKEAGAIIYNIIPLIPQHKLKDIERPTCELLEKAREDAEQYIKVFRHCAHCRADAVGVPGVSEYSKLVYQNRLNVRSTFSHG